MTQIITNSIPCGIVGDITRSGNCDIESALQQTALPVTKYGLPVKLVAGEVTGLVSGDTPDLIKGFLVRPFPQYPGVGTNEAFGVATPPIAPAFVNFLKRGYIAVKVLDGTPAKDGKVYARIASTSSIRLQGGIESAAAKTVTSPAIVGTGSGTIACTVSNHSLIKPGTYVITLQTTSQTAVCTVIDPDGIRLRDAIVGTAYDCQGLAFTITAGGTMTAADKYSPVVTATTIEIPEAFFTGAMTGVVANGDAVAEVAYKI